MGVKFDTMACVEINKHKYRLEYVCYANLTKMDLYMWADVSEYELLADILSDDFKNFLKRDIFKGRIFALSVNGHEAQCDLPVTATKKNINGKITHTLKSYIDFKK